MKKLSKTIVAITLLFFMGQTYAAVLMSCNISPDSMSTSNHHESGHKQLGDNQHPMDHEKDVEEVSLTEVSLTEVSLVKVTLQQNCETNKHDCQCEMGSCSSQALPASHVFLSLGQIIPTLQKSHHFSSQNISHLFRPPILA